MSSYLDQNGTQYLWGKIKTWVGSQGYLKTHQTVTDASPTLSWGATSKVATIGNTDIHVKMPSNPNTDTKVKQEVTTLGASAKYLIFSNSTSTNTDQVYKDGRFYINGSPSLIVQDSSNRSASLTPGVGISIDNGNNVGARLEYDNLWLFGTGNTWDGSNGSLKAALSGKSGTGHNHDSTYLKLSGGYLTGNASRKLSGVTLNTTSNNSCTAYQEGNWLVTDSGGTWIARALGNAETNGNISFFAQAQNKKTDGTTVSNSLQLGVKKDGTRFVNISDGGIWRTAIGAAASSHNHPTSSVIYAKEFSTTIGKTNGSHASVTAGSVSGYTFICWVNVMTSGWVGSCYIQSPLKATTNIWVGASASTSGTGQADACALYVKNSI